jgi:protein SMG8
MSGLGSYTSFFPGQCTPVILFVFVDDFSDVPNPSPNVVESTDTSSFNQSSSLSSLARPSMPVKGSVSVMVLARPVNKSEGGFRKKLQSSLEAQIRFLIKKCRILSGSETSHPGSRSGVASSSAPLFSLDASRAVVLLDQSTSQRCESLEFAIGLVEDVFNGKETSDSLLLETHGQSASKEDVLSLKEFIYKQCDILRGRGGLVSNTNSGSAAGVGMVAVAAAAAAASAASGKTFTAPELPNLEIWLSSSQVILQGVLSGKGGCIDETEIGKRKPRLVNTAAPPRVEGPALKNMDPLDVAVSWLECGRGLNTKFSTRWCERALPAAKEVYLNNLPACYPTLLHEAHLEKALHAFHSMVKGPAVQCFAKKLEDECTHIWKSGRQLCDAVSLTGKPCMHQRHDVQTDQSDLEAGVKPHSSGYVFLRACTCGRSRQLQADPFDFESANIFSSCFPDCDRLLPALQLPKVSNTGPIQLSSWSLIRVGGARYYEPSKGLLQSGFSATQKFLLKWTIFLDMRKSPNGLPKSAVQHGSLTRSSAKLKVNADMDIKKTGIAQMYSGDLQTGGEHLGKPSENIKFGDSKISFGRGLPNFILRKPFSAVVAGSAATDSGFPPLQQSRQSLSFSDKDKQNRARDRSVEQAHATDDDQGSQKSEEILSGLQALNGVDTNGYTDGDPFLRIGSNVVPVNVNGGEEMKMNPSLKHVIAYVGFEHECPHGHRFLLNPEHFNELGSSYSLFEESHITSSVEISDHNVAYPSNLRKNGGHGKVHRNSKVMTASALKKEKSMDKPKEIVANGKLYLGGMIQFSGAGKEQNQTSFSLSKLPNFVKELEGGLQSIGLDDGGCAFSMLNRNIPVFMNCPHCRLSTKKKDLPKIKFAGTISQLQRIFLVPNVAYMHFSYIYINSLQNKIWAF